MRTRITLFAIAGVLVLVLAACGSSYGDGDDDTDRKRRDASTEEPQSPSYGRERRDPEGVEIGQTSLGQVLVDDRRHTLYGFTDDTSGTSTCFGACATTWPAVPGESAIGGDLDPSIFHAVDRADGESQLAAGKWPAYTYAGDDAAGEVNGQGSGGVWFALAPDGSLIK